MRQRQQGMTLIGLLCILALVGVILYAGIRLRHGVSQLHEGRTQHGGDGG